jgi:hypothetical protein
MLTIKIFLLINFHIIFFKKHKHLSKYLSKTNTKKYQNVKYFMQNCKNQHFFF